METEEKKITLGIVASGSGTDFNAIATAWKKGQIPNVSRIVLFGTKGGAGCFDKAIRLQIPFIHVECLNKSEVLNFNQRLKQACINQDIQMLFLAGCVWEIQTRGFNVPVYNIHPANTKLHGGRHLYGLAVHIHVLREIWDLLWREAKSRTDKFFTQICIHQVRSDLPIDCGKVIMTLDVPIPSGIILKLSELEPGDDFNFLAEILQKHVLKYEHLLLPGAVNILAKMCLDAMQQ